MNPKYKKDIPRAPYYRREIVPTVVQMEAVECGAACLSMILRYYGKHVTLEELRSACGVTRDGASVLGVLKAAQTYGLLAEAHLMDLEDLYDMPLPLILYWEFRHFVVVEGFSREGVFINDPAVGPYTITYDQLNRSFTGLAMLFDLSLTFEKTGVARNTFEIITKLIRRATIPFSYAFLTGLCLVVPGLAVPAFTQFFIDTILVQRNFSFGAWFLFAMGLVVILTVLLKALQQRVLSRLYIQLSTLYSSEFLWHILRLPYFFYVQRYSGEIANRMALNETVSKTLTTRLISMVIDVTVAFVFGVAMFYYDPLIAAFGIAIIAADFWLMRYLYRSREDAYYYYQQTSSKSLSYSINALKGMETLKSTGMEYIYFSRWAGYYTKALNAMQEIGKKDVYAGVFPAFLQLLSLIMILSFGTWRVINGELTIGMLMALVILMENFTEPITRLVNYNQIAQLLKIDTARLDDVLKNPIDNVLVQAEQDESKLVKEITYPKLKGTVEVRNVTFGFDRTADPFLLNINCLITPGTYVGVVGSTGSGKSTLAKIIAGLVEPWEGEILFDHIPKNQVPRSLIVSSMSVVEQESMLFSGTVKDNIAFFNPLVPLEEVVKAAKDACIHDLIVSRKGGYDLILQANGSNLSGGERQRIELARALVKQPSVLILDEATSALDTDTEAQVMQNIRHRGCTCFIIAHRLNTIRYCDEILVLDKGVLVQRGTPDELQLVPGLYRDLVEIEKMQPSGRT